MAYRSNVIPNRNVSPEGLARGLGWFSIGLGVAEMLMARRLTRASGLPGKSGVVRFYGLREIGAGIGILSSKHPKKLGPWIWGRVAGDVLDIATAASALRAANSKRGRAAVTLLALAGVTLVDVVCAQQLNKKA